MVADLLTDAEILCLGSDVVSGCERKHTRPPSDEQRRMIIAPCAQIHLDPLRAPIREVHDIILVRLAVLDAYFVGVKVHFIFIHTTRLPYPHASIK